MAGYQEDIASIFSKANKDKSGTLNIKEFQEVVGDLCERYPQLELYLKKKQMKNIADLLKISQNESVEVDIETFTSALSEVDSQMKNLPATAQVIYQPITLLSIGFLKKKFLVFVQLI